MATGNRILDAGVLAQKVATPEAGDCPYTLLLGAGASVSSGVRTVEAMVREWKMRLFMDELGISEMGMGTDASQNAAAFEGWLKESYPKWQETYADPDESEYAALFGHFYQHPKERQMYIEKVVEEGRPTFGYRTRSARISVS